VLEGAQECVVYSVEGSFNVEFQQGRNGAVGSGSIRNRIILQNHIVYNIRGSSQLPLCFPPGLRTVVIRLTISLPSSVESYRDRYDPYTSDLFAP
jgi:hypothetical protein